MRQHKLGHIEAAERDRLLAGLHGELWVHLYLALLRDSRMTKSELYAQIGVILDTPPAGMPVAAPHGGRTGAQMWPRVSSHRPEPIRP